MNLSDKVTIVIPCYNEEKYIGKTLRSIAEQKGIKGTTVIIADGGSTDGTIKVINKAVDKYSKNLNIRLIKGGSVAVGRNKGAKQVTTKYVLFLDADATILCHDAILHATMHLDKGKKLITCKVESTSKDIRARMSFSLFNIVNSIISMHTPFAVGTFFMTSVKSFNSRGGFDTSLQHSEDYHLSRKYLSHEFKIIDKYIGQDDRRFKKMGYLGMVKLLIKNFLNRNNKEYFKKDIGYWK